MFADETLAAITARTGSRGVRARGRLLAEETGRFSDSG
jgi:hypothetical protein